MMPLLVSTGQKICCNKGIRQVITSQVSQGSFRRHLCTLASLHATQSNDVCHNIFCGIREATNDTSRMQVPAVTSKMHHLIDDFGMSSSLQHKVDDLI